MNRPFIDPYYTKFSRVQSVDNVDNSQVMRTTHQFVEYSCIDDVKSSEFSLGNLVAIGAIDNMHYVTMSVNHDMDFVDNFAKSYNSVVSDVTQVIKSQEG